MSSFWSWLSRWIVIEHPPARSVLSGVNIQRRKLYNSIARIYTEMSEPQCFRVSMDLVERAKYVYKFQLLQMGFFSWFSDYLDFVEIQLESRVGANRFVLATFVVSP
jgi:hypothetical protein